MAKRRMAVIVVFVCLCFLLMPFYANASSTTEASEPINTNQECTLTLSYICDGIIFEDLSVKLYKVADVSANYNYTLTDSFADYDINLNGIQNNSEWNVIRSTLEASITADNIEANSIAKTDSNGQACFKNLKPGLYLALVGTVMQGDMSYFFDSALVALPGLDMDGFWQYQVSVSSKSQVIPPSDKEVELKVVKLWKGDEEANSRPESVEVQIFRDATSYKNVVLSEENNWSYSWFAKENEANWTVIERNIPSEYTMTVEKRDTSFVLTNTYIKENPDEIIETPQTGDTSNIILYVILMFVSASILIILGIIGKRNSDEKIK